MKYWPNHVLVNMNVTATYFYGQDQMSQIEFHKLFMKTLIYNNHYNEEMDETPDTKCKKQETSHCLVMLTIWKKISGMQIITANSAYPQHKCKTCKEGYVPIAFVLQVSISLLNASGITWSVPKTILQRLAESS